MGVSVGADVAVGVAASGCVGEKLGVGLADGLGVLVGVGLAFGCAEVKDTNGQLQPKVTIATTTVITSAFLLSLSKSVVPFPLVPPIQVRLQAFDLID